MPKLNQVIAVEKRVKSDATAVLTKAYQDTQKAPLLSGIARSYKPRDDEGEQFPPESTRVQLRVNDTVLTVQAALTRFYDLTLTKDLANTAAKADLRVEGTLIAEQVPVTFLLFLEKQLQDVLTFVSKLPVLDPSETWTYDPNTDTYATAPTQTVKTKKIPRNHELAPATDKHPAQVQVFTEDVLVGNWTTVKYSGAVTQQWVAGVKARTTALIEAVKTAREEANTVAVVYQSIGTDLFNYLFTG
jgi:hypothetical protein